MQRIHHVVLVVLFAIVLWACDESETGAPEAQDANEDVGADAGDLTVDAPDIFEDPCPPLPTLSEPSDLPETGDPPPLLTFSNGDPVETQEDWACRRRELLALFEHYVYGQPAAATEPVAEGAVRRDRVQSGILLEQVSLQYGADDRAIHLALFLPEGEGDVPVFIALNPCGNHTLHPTELLRVSDGFVDPTCDSAARERGGREARWPLGTILGRGYGLAVFHQSDLTPDDPDSARSVGAIGALDTGGGAGAEWGAVASWAWGIQRAVDYLVTHPRVDAQRIAVTGHSRRGKAALLAGAYDERIAVVIPHQFDAHDGVPTLDFRRHCAGRVFETTARYDGLIARGLFGGEHTLRYGENPHQDAAWWIDGGGDLATLGLDLNGGKALSYNNILDVVGALKLSLDLPADACAIIKHSNPCGVGRGETVAASIENALQGDPVSAFGGIVALGREVDEEAAELLAGRFLEVVLAPGYTDGARSILGGQEEPAVARRRSRSIRRVHAWQRASMGTSRSRAG